MTVRFGLFGTGPWAARQAQALAAHPGVSLVGVWGRDPAKASTVAGRHGARGYVEVDRLLADVDAVVVAVPPDVQPDLAVRAARAGRHLLLDKPLAFTRVEADRIVNEVRHAGVASVVFFTNLFRPDIAAFVRQAADRTWHGGRATLLTSIFRGDSPYGASPWRRERGGLWDIGPHALSMLLPVLGPVADVTAMSGPHGITHMLVRHASDAVSSLVVSLDAPDGATGHEVVFFGDEGAVMMPSSAVSSDVAAGFAIGELVDAIGANDRHHPYDVRFARDVVDVLERAQAAASSRPPRG